jgi:tripartite-type tricarboxylate transporter receptor subunit TctC
MKLLHRRQFLHLAAGAAAVPAASRMAAAQAYPTRPVRMIVPAAAGGVVDILARTIGQRLSERLGQQFVIEDLQIPAHRGQSFRRIADSVPVIADSF